MIETLISSKTRVKLLLKFFLNPEITSYLRGLEAEFGESSNAIRVELNRFENAGLLEIKSQGNKKMFKANISHPFFSVIQSMMMKHTGLENILERVVGTLGDIQLVYLVGDLAKGIKSNVIDILIFGTVDKISLNKIVTKAEKTVNTSINCQIINLSDWSEGFMKKNYQNYLVLWTK